MAAPRIKQGLRATPHDDRDFSFGAVVGIASLAELPKEYRVGDPLVVKDQGETDMCTAYALTAVSEDQEGVALSPFFTFGKTKKITGEKDEWGADLRSACKSGVGDGFLELFGSTIDAVKRPATQEERDQAAEWMRISSTDEYLAQQHKKKTFFAVDGPYDVFDNMRSAMWRARSERRSVFTGCKWRQEWTNAPGGVIDAVGSGSAFGHALKAFGWEDDRMILQLSNGAAIGDQGIFKISRDALNEAFTFGAFTFMDMPREEAEAAIEKRERKSAVSTFFSWLPWLIIKK